MTKSENKHDTAHEIVKFRQCAFGDGGYNYTDGYDRAICTCGWISAADRNKHVLIEIWKIHAGK
jgi:hypothetical protein